MDSVDMFKRDSEEHAFRKETRKRLIIITVSIVVLVMIIITALVGILGPLRNDNSNKSPSSSSPTGTTESIKAVCSVTLYPDSCSSSMSSLRSSSNSTSDNPEDLFVLSLQAAVDALVEFSSFPQILINSNFTTDPLATNALSICENVIWDAIDHVSMAYVKFGGKSNRMFPSSSTINDIRTWLSTAITYQETCIDGLIEYSKNDSKLTDQVKTAMRNSSEFTSNSLAIVTKIVSHLKVPLNRKLLHSEANGGPSWFYQAGERRLLQDLAKTLPKADVTVAKDGSGDFRTIRQAVSSIPEKSPSRYVIYIKEGVYTENVTIGKRLWNVTMYGDGMGKTIITNNLNFVDKTPTFISGTLIAEGRGFIAMHMTFRNTAGPEKEQAVAMRSSADHSIFYRCSFDAYQDTLYAHANRQFYRDCHITGTVDFIFGNAAVVFQNCTIQPRQPLPNQFIAITAQGRSDPNQNTGICIQGCDITTTLQNQVVTAPTYLGRPWKNYSTTVVTHSKIGQLLNPRGWTEWTRNVIPPVTIFYGEYQNSGAGSLLDQRVAWDGYRRNLTDRQASRFTVEALIQGSEWLTDHARVYNYDLNV